MDHKATFTHTTARDRDLPDEALRKIAGAYGGGAAGPTVIDAATQRQIGYVTSVHVDGRRVDFEVELTVDPGSYDTPAPLWGGWTKDSEGNVTEVILLSVNLSREPESPTRTGRA